MADCCNDFTRSQLLRNGAARAGQGLPAIEPGMPVPAGTGMSRRSMLLRSAGLALAVYGAGRTLTPQAFEAAVAEAAGERKVLISIFMDGGADALSLLAPTGDPRYRVLRPQLALAPDAGWAFPADTRLRWHPSAQGLRELWEDPSVGVAVAPAIGYTSPNQSHFTSRHYWEVGATDPNASTGWLGRYLDRVGQPDLPIQGISLDGSLSPQLATASVAVAAASNLRSYSFYTDVVYNEMQDRMRAAMATIGTLPSGNPIMAQARKAQANAASWPASWPPSATGHRRRARATRRRRAHSRRARRRSRGCSRRTTRRATPFRCAA